MSLDGSNVRLAEKGPKPGRPSTGDDGALAPTCFKNCKVGTVSLYGAVAPKTATPTLLRTRFTSHMPEDHSVTFNRDFEAEVADTVARCPPEVVKVAVLDAAAALWDYLNETPTFAEFEKIIDFYHVTEHVALVGDALFGKGSVPTKEWNATHRHSLLDHDDGAARIIAAIDHESGSRELSAANRVEVLKQRNYFAKHGDRMTYASFRARGLPIGSGPVEAAGKSLIKVRLGRGGMRWKRDKGQHVLAIRTIIKSERWDKVWQEYLHLANAA